MYLCGTLNFSSFQQATTQLHNCWVINRIQEEDLTNIFQVSEIHWKELSMKDGQDYSLAMDFFMELFSFL